MGQFDEQKFKLQGQFNWTSFRSYVFRSDVVVCTAILEGCNCTTKLKLLSETCLDCRCKISCFTRGVKRWNFVLKLVGDTSFCCRSRKQYYSFWNSCVKSTRGKFQLKWPCYTPVNCSLIYWIDATPYTIQYEVCLYFFFLFLIKTAIILLSGAS